MSTTPKVEIYDDDPMLPTAKVEVHILTHDAEPMLEFSLRHYRAFASDIYVHDGGPLFHSADVIKQMITNDYSPCVIHWEIWDTKAQLNDELAMQLKNECWKGTNADWVIVADADELIHFPAGAAESLFVYEKRGAAVIKPYGYEMFSEDFPNSRLPITEQCKNGAPEDQWYSKPILFSPNRVEETGFGVGAHESTPILKNGVKLHVGRDWPKPNNPRTLLLHYHQIGPLSYVAGRYDATRKRLARVNELNGWGNFKDGAAHAIEKREYIMPRLQRVIP